MGADEPNWGLLRLPYGYPVLPHISYLHLTESHGKVYEKCADTPQLAAMTQLNAQCVCSGRLETQGGR
eukprot:6195602-Pleurochrysis_carterae.AAC.2